MSIAKEIVNEDRYSNGTRLINLLENGKND